MRVDHSEKRDAGRGRKAAVLLLAAIALSACSHFDTEPPIASGPVTAKYFTITVGRGDTISQIARRYQVSALDMIDANDLTDRDRIYAGQVLRVPGAARAPGAAYAARTIPVPQSRPRSKVTRTAPAITLASYTPPDDNNTILDQAQSVIDRLASGAPNDRDVSAYQDTSRDSGLARFAWPLSGRIISPFGKSASGERNDGINIAAHLGAPIHAAAAGVVTYSGNELKGYGNLVLIKHEDGYVTAYAHAERTLVNKGEKVTKGQVIAYTGETGDVTEPQLHFEIRHDTKPVDPRPLLVAAR